MIKSLTNWHRPLTAGYTKLEEQEEEEDEEDTEVGLILLETAADTSRVVLDENTMGISLCEWEWESMKRCEEWAWAASIRLVTTPGEHWQRVTWRNMSVWRTEKAKTLK